MNYFKTVIIILGENMNTILIHLLIFTLKLIEAWLKHYRGVLMINNERGKLAFITFIRTFFDVVSLVFVVGIDASLSKFAVYLLGSFFGAYLSSHYFKNYSNSKSMAIAISENKRIIEVLRNQDFAVTEIEGEGQDGDKTIMIIVTKNKRKPFLYKTLNEYNSFVLSEGINGLDGGTL